MEEVNLSEVQKLYLPPRDSHKGQNGRLLVIGGSHLFHAASLWALEVASRIVDLVHYSSVPENNKLVMQIKSAFRDGIVVPRQDVEAYIKEDNCILIGPGMVRSEAAQLTTDNLQLTTLKDIEKINDEGAQTAALTNYLLKKYPHKQWVIDAGALQMMDLSLIPKKAILTPHQGEFEGLKAKIKQAKAKTLLEKADLGEQVAFLAREYQCILLVKGVRDIVCSGNSCRQVTGGNVGMTKGGTGDVLAGLIAALACKNDPYLAASAASFINKKAGEDLAKIKGIYFNASDLARQIPQTMARLLRE